MSVRIGLDSFYYTKLLTDPVGGPATYDTTKRIKGITGLNFTSNASVDTLFAEDAPFEVATTLGQLEVEITMAQLPPEDKAIWLGNDYTNGVTTKNNQDKPIYIAIGFRTQKADGTYIYKWYLKGKFREPDQSSETKGDSINFQQDVMIGNFVQREADGNWAYECDSGDTNTLPVTITKWFDQPDPQFV